MRKKLLLSIFSIFIGFIFFSNVSANSKGYTIEYACSYGYDFSQVDIKFIQYGDWITLASAECSDGESRIDCTKSFSEFKGMKETGVGGCSIYKYDVTLKETLKKMLGDNFKIVRDFHNSTMIQSACYDYVLSDSCKEQSKYSCIWNETKHGDYCNVDKLLYVKCGDAKDIPYQVPEVVSFAVNLLKIATPLILIFVSIISLLKAISSGNEDEMKKSQKGLVRKIIAAVMVFFIIAIVQFVIMKVADSEIKSDENGQVETENLSDCLNCFLNNECLVYYKTNVAGEYMCTYLNDPYNHKICDEKLTK